MKNLLVKCFGVLFIMIHVMSFSQKTYFSDLSGPYLGQSPPGDSAEVFAPGVISTGYGERIAAFTSDGRELYYVVTGAPHSVILCTREIDGKWTEPKIVSFSGKRSAEFNMSPDGNKILYIPKPFKNDDQVWMVERENVSWSKPVALPQYINGYPTIARNGNIYFNALNENNNSWDVYMSEYLNGTYQKPVHLGYELNNEYHEADPFIAPDESYLIFARKQPDTFGGADLFISFKNEDGNWSKAVNMGAEINSESDDYCPTVSPDGKYLFLMSYRKVYKNKSEYPITYKEKIKILNSPGNGNSDIYWIDAKIIEQLKSKYLK